MSAAGGEPLGTAASFGESEPWDQTVKRLFARCDLNGDGTLNKREIIKVCRQDPEVADIFGLPHAVRQEDGSRVALEQFFQSLDSDGNREISWSEFYNWFCSHPFGGGQQYSKEVSNSRPAPALPIAGARMKGDMSTSDLANNDSAEQLHMMMVTVPEGAEPGQLIQFRAPDGMMMQVSVPENETPGNEFQVQISHITAHDGVVVTLTVPEGVEPGQIVLFDAPDGTCMRVFVPEGRAPGEEFQVMLAPPTQQLKLTVPSGLQGGQAFDFKAPSGKQMRTQVPNGLKSGDSFLVSVKRVGGGPPSGPGLSGANSPGKDNVGPGLDSNLGPSADTSKEYSSSAVNPSTGAGNPALQQNYNEFRGSTIPSEQPAAYSGIGNLCSKVGTGNLEGVKRCVAEGVSVNAVYDAGFTPLFYAAIDGYAHIAQWLIEQRADVMALNSEQRTPLHWAARSGHTEVIKLLLDARADSDLKDGTGRTPLDLARQKGQTKAAELLDVAEQREDADEFYGNDVVY